MLSRLVCEEIIKRWEGITESVLFWMFDYSLKVYRVEDIHILFLSKVNQSSPNLHFRRLNKPTYGNVFDLPLPLWEWLLYIPGTLHLEGLCPPSTPACLLSQVLPVVQIHLRWSGKLLPLNPIAFWETSVPLQAKPDKQQLENKICFRSVRCIGGNIK